jgi:hypothetical protein
MLKDLANLKYVITPCDVPTCVATKWGALFSELYHKYHPHAVIGPGKILDCSLILISSFSNYVCSFAYFYLNALYLTF